MKKRISRDSVIFLTAIFIFIISFSFYLFHSYKRANNIQNVYYRIYTKKEGWSKWYKNGKIAESNSPILDIEVKSSKKDEDNILGHSVYSNNKWYADSDKYESKNKVFGLRIGVIDDSSKSVFYRTYNDKDKWLEWTTDGNTSGNKNEPIKKVQIKLLLTGSSLSDYLENYGIVEKKSKGF